jgi:hypothetical protein
MSSLLVFKFIDWRHSQYVCIFYPALWTIATLTFSLVHLPPTPQSQSTIIQTVCGWKGVGEGVDLCWRPYSAGV